MPNTLAGPVPWRLLVAPAADSADSAHHARRCRWLGQLPGRRGSFQQLVTALAAETVREHAGRSPDQLGPAPSVRVAPCPR